MTDHLFDVSVPNVARMYDYMLGGKDNFEADRAAAEELRKWLPDVVTTCRQNRKFLKRAVTYLAGECGIRQFIDIGAGLPTVENTHEVAQAVAPGVRVVYVDYDPVVLGHATAMLATEPDVIAVRGDLRNPASIFGSVAVGDLIDFTQPVAILLVAVLHFIRDTEDPYGLVGLLKAAMAPGSYMVISHATADNVSPEDKTAGLEVYEHASENVEPRSYGDVLKFFAGMELVEPGLVGISQWRPDGMKSKRELVYGGVARQPGPHL